MSDFPYTDEQVATFHKAMFRHLYSPTVYPSHEYLSRLHEAGITVNFPEPRFYIVPDRYVTGTPRWFVRDRSVHANVAWFYGDAAESHAREHADRLNREDAA